MSIETNNHHPNINTTIVASLTGIPRARNIALIPKDSGIVDRNGRRREKQSTVFTMIRAQFRPRRRAIATVVEIATKTRRAGMTANL